MNPFLSDLDEDEDRSRRPTSGGQDFGWVPEAAWAEALRTRCRPRTPWPWGAVPERGSRGRRRRRPGGPGETPARLSIDAIAAQLLRDQYLLTALELHTELLESGRELPRLRDYFSNPGNFERQSGTPPGTGAPGIPGATGLGGAGGREPSTTSGGGQLSK